MVDKLIITEEYTIPRALKERVQLHPDQLALIDERSRQTYAEVDEQVCKLAAGLKNLGIKPGDKVVLVLPSGNNYPIAMLAVIQIGGVSVGINPTLKQNEFEHIFKDSEAVAVIVSDAIHGVDPLTIIREIKSEIPTLEHIIVDGDTEGTEINYRDLVERSAAWDGYHQANPDDLAVLVYTSGTTGLPKGSMHSHLSLLYGVRGGDDPPPTIKDLINVLRRFGFGYFLRVLRSIGKPLKCLGTTPPYTAAGMIVLINIFVKGRILYQTDRYIPSEMLRIVDEEGIHVIGFPPALGALLLKNPNLEKYNLSSLLYVLMGTAPVPPSLVDEFLEKIGVPVAIGYGASELFGGPTVQKPFSDSKKALRETVGKIKPDFEAKIVDEDRKPLPIGEVGELVVRGGLKMLGYYKAETLTRDTFDDDGWYYTGDLATIDTEGYVRIVGRVKDMIIRGGQNIYPAELEEVLRGNPMVNEVAVIGIPDAIAGEKVLAYIIPESGTEPTVLEIMEFCRENMAPYKVPANITFTDAFPLNATGKVLKRVLREEAIKSS